MYTCTAFTVAATIFSVAITEAIVPSGRTNVAVSPNTQSLGDLAGDNLVKKVTTLLQTACPEHASPDTATPCAADPAGVSIDDVVVITNPGEILGGGSIILTIKEGNYSYATQRDGIIATFAQTLKVAATGKNCQTNVR